MGSPGFQVTLYFLCMIVIYFGMKYRALGTTGIIVSEIGFGAWGIGGLTKGATSYGITDDKNSLTALKVAFECGVTLYDTANIYGEGKSEELIGRAFRGMRDKVVIASKCGFASVDGDQDFSSVAIRVSVTDSLARLGTDYLDILQLHSPTLDIISLTGAHETLMDMKRDGIIRAFGISVRSPEDGIVAIRDFGFESVQVNFNMADQRALDCGLFEIARERGVGVVIRTPLAFGFLGGEVPENLSFFDHRSHWSLEQRTMWRQASDAFDALGVRGDRTRVQFALAFCLAFPEISSVIPGILISAHALENSVVSDKEPLSQAAISAIRGVWKKESFFSR